jgi:hypothetical protein
MATNYYRHCFDVTSSKCILCTRNWAFQSDEQLHRDAFIKCKYLPRGRAYRGSYPITPLKPTLESLRNIAWIVNGQIQL